MKRIIKIILVSTILGGTALAASVSVLTPPSISEKISNKPQIEKSQIKSLEIAKKGNEFAGIYNSSQYGVKIEIIGEVKAIEVNGQHGIELFAKAWRGTQQLGFGADGTVEIERFRIFNPPILVDDPNGMIIRTMIDLEGKTNTRKLREDPIEAIRQVIAHNAKLVGKENAKIIIGKTGNTTSTFYPDSGNPGATTVDGMAERVGVNQTFGNIRAGLGNEIFNGASEKMVWLQPSATANQYKQLGRSKYTFNTAAIADADTISSATFSVYGVSSNDVLTLNATDRIVYLVSSGGSATTLANSNYENTGTVNFGTFDPGSGLASWSTIAYNDFTLNASGLTNISKTGVSFFGLRWGADFNNSFTSTWVTDTGDPSRLNGYFADQAGTASDPKLVVVHSASDVSSKTIIKGKVIFQGKTIMR